MVQKLNKGHRIYRKLRRKVVRTFNIMKKTKPEELFDRNIKLGFGFNRLPYKRGGGILIIQK